MTPEKLANTILEAAGSNLRHYTHFNKERILEAATTLLTTTLDDEQLTIFKTALIDLQHHQEWRMGADNIQMRPHQVTWCIDKAIEALQILTGEK